MCPYNMENMPVPSVCWKCPYYLWYKQYHNTIGRDQCNAVCPQHFNTGGYCGKTCTLTQGHYGPHICPDGHQWY